MTKAKEGEFVPGYALHEFPLFIWYTYPQLLLKNAAPRPGSFFDRHGGSVLRRRQHAMFLKHFHKVTALHGACGCETVGLVKTTTCINPRNTAKCIIEYAHAAPYRIIQFFPIRTLEQPNQRPACIGGHVLNAIVRLKIGNRTRRPLFLQVSRRREDT